MHPSNTAKEGVKVKLSHPTLLCVKQIAIITNLQNRGLLGEWVDTKGDVSNPPDTKTKFLLLPLMHPFTSLSILVQGVSQIGCSLM